MQILFLTWNFPPKVGGIEYLIFNLRSGLRARAHAVETVTSFTETRGSDEVGVYRSPWRGLAGYVGYSFLRGFQRCLRRRPQVILCGSLVSAPAGWMLARLFRRPWALIAYGGDVVHSGRLYQRVARFLFRRADLLLPISTHTAGLLREIGARAERMTIVPPGVDTRGFDTPPAQRDPAVSDMCRGRRVLLSVGRLIPRKGILQFVEQAMPELARRFPDLLFAVIGEDAQESLIHREGGSMRTRIENAVRAQNLSEQVKLLGKVSDAQLREWYFASHLFILPVIEIPGDAEGFGIVFSEAALAGVPIIASRSGGVVDAVEDGVSGQLVPPGDYPALVGAISDLLRDEARRVRMGQAAGERARRLFAWDTVVPQYERALSALPGRDAAQPLPHHAEP